MKPTMQTRCGSFLWLLALTLLALPVSAASGAPSAYERQILAAVLVLEAADQGEPGMWAVLHVINNRAGGDPSRAVGKVAVPKAFSSLNGVTSQRHPDYGPVIRRAMRDRMWANARAIIDAYAEGRLQPDATRGATHFCIHPPAAWLASMTVTARIGDHVFLREAGR